MEHNNQIEQNTQSHNEQEIDLLQLARMLLRHWQWYVGALAIALLTGFLYLKSTPKQYERSAMVLIKDDKTGGSSLQGGMGSLADLGDFGLKSSVDNELLVFQSNTLLTEVVRRLKLHTTYQVRSGLRLQDLYGQQPFEVEFIEASPNQGFELEGQLKEGVLRLSNIKTHSAGQKVKLAEVSLALNDTVDSEVGKITARPTGFTQHQEEKIRIRRNGVKNTTLAYGQALQIALADKKATMIKLLLRNEVPQRAEDVLNTLIDVYNEEAINDKNQMAMATSDFINERLIIIEKELGGVDSQIEQYKKAQKLTDIKADAEMMITQTTGLKQEELAVLNELSLAQFIKDYLGDTNNRGKLIPANTGISDSNTEGQIAEYNKMLLQRDRLLANSSESNPVVSDLTKSLFAMEQNISRSVDNVISGLNLKLENIRARDKQTLKRIESVPSQEKYVLTVGRQQKIKESLYLFLLNKREENALAQAITQSNARVIDSARGSDSPVAPRSMMIMAGALFLGLLLPTGVILLLSFMDSKVRDRHDIDEVLDVPFLGEVPQMDDKGDTDLVVEEHSRNAISEAFRIIRTNISFMGQGRDNQVLTFTSLSPNSGKSFVAVNIAVSLAMGGKKVVVIDLDIRKRQLSERLEIDHLPGATQYLSGAITNIAEVVHHSDHHPKLFYLPAGPVPPNPAELLERDTLDKMIEELRKEYDYIFIDSVPAMVVADALITNRVADSTIYVIRAGMFEKRMLPFIERLKQSGKFKNLSVVLNGVKPNKRGYYKYGYGYGYGYGDGEE